MTIESTITELKDAAAPSRQLDRSIAELIGWKRALLPAFDESTGEQKSNPVWLAPKDGAPANVPFYTSNLEDAFRLSQMVAPLSVGGCAWEQGSASAQIGEGNPKIQAATPAIALCIAALLIVRRNGTAAVS